MVRKVIAGQELLRASGTVTGKLVTWLAARGYIDRDSADHATGRAQDAWRDLPVADRLGGLLRRRRGRTRDRRRRAGRSRLGRGSPCDQRRGARSDLVRGRHRADRRPTPGQRSRTTGMVGIRHGGTHQGQLAPARGRLRLRLTRGTPAPIRRRNTQTAPDSQLATARRAAAHSVVGQLAKPDRDQSLPPGIGEPGCSSRALPSPARRCAGRSAASQAGRSKRGVQAAEDGDPGDRWGIAVAPFKDRPRTLRPRARSRRPIAK